MYYRVLQDFTFGKIGGKKDDVIRIPTYYVPYLLLMGYIAPVHPASPGPADAIPFYDRNGNVIFTIDAINRRVDFPATGIFSIDGTPLTATIAQLNAVAGLGSSIGTAKLENGAVTPAKTSGIAVLYDLGAPLSASNDSVCASQDMDNKEYTLEAAPDPDVPRNITVTRTVVDDADTPGVIMITGTNYNDEEITEEIIPGDHGVTVAGVKAFKTVTSIIGSAWVQGGTDPDTIVVGIGNVIGCPVATKDADNIMLGMLGGAVVAHNVSVDLSGVIELTTVDMSTGTYNGTKKALIWQKY